MCSLQAWAQAAATANSPTENTTSTTASSAAPTKEPDVIYVPTPQAVVDRMLELADIKKDDVVYDLGCGDGRIVISAAKKYGVKAVGFDIDPKRVKESQENVSLNHLEDLVTIKQHDIFELDLTKANVITLYLLPSLNVRLIPQLEKMKPGCRILSHAFDMQGVKPDQVVHVGDRVIYKWTTPLKREENNKK
jgi:predicted RNA methylase